MLGLYFFVYFGRAAARNIHNETLVVLRPAIMFGTQLLHDNLNIHVLHSVIKYISQNIYTH